MHRLFWKEHRAYELFVMVNVNEVPFLLYHVLLSSLMGARGQIKWLWENGYCCDKGARKAEMILLHVKKLKNYTM